MTKKTHPKKQHRSNSIYVTFEHILNGGIPKQLWKNKILKKHKVLYALTVLRRSNYVVKRGKGVWEATIDKLPKDRSNFTRGITQGVTNKHTPILDRKPDTVRLHGMRILIKLPSRLEGWKDRVKLLKKLKIDYVPIVQGQRISFEKVEKIWLTKDSIYIYFSTRDKKAQSQPPFSWYANNADDALLIATNYILKFIGRLERHLHANFTLGGKYRIKFTNRHYSLIKNAIARKYNDENKKFFGFDDTGCWIIIDNSFNLLELETIHPDTAHDDNKIVQEGLNGWKKGFTPQVLAKSISDVSNQLQTATGVIETSVKNQDYYGQHIRDHVGAIQDLGTGVRELTKLIKNLKLKEKK